MNKNKPSVNEHGVYTMTEAAQALGVTRKTMQRYARLGYIQFYTRRCDRRRVTTGKGILRCWEDFY